MTALFVSKSLLVPMNLVTLWLGLLRLQHARDVVLRHIRAVILANKLSGDCFHHDLHGKFASKCDIQVLS